FQQAISAAASQATPCPFAAPALAHLRRASFASSREGWMAEQAEDLVPDSAPAPRGGDFIFTPVGARPSMCPERFTEEQRQFFAAGMDFVKSEILPAIEALEEKDNPRLRDLLGKAGEVGLCGVDVLEAYGGLGL